MIQLFNPFSKKDESTDTVSMLTSLRTGIMSKITPSEEQPHDVKENLDTDVESGQEAPEHSVLPVNDIPDLDAVAGYMLQFAEKIGKIKPEHSTSISEDNILDIRNFRSVLYFADWEFTRRHGRRLTEIVWYASDYDYNINTASRFDVILDHEVFDFGYRIVGEKRTNHLLTKVSLRRDHNDYNFAFALGHEVRTHLEHIVAAYTAMASRPRTFPSSYEPKGGDSRTYYDLDLTEIAAIERREHRVKVKPFMSLEDKKFDPANFTLFRNNVQFDFYRSLTDHDGRFASALLKITGNKFFAENPEKLHIRSAFPHPLWETDDEISVMDVDEETGFGKEYMIRLEGKSFYIFALLTDAEYASLTDSQHEFFKIAPEDDFDSLAGKPDPNKERLIEFRGECKINLDLHVVTDPTRETGVKTSFAEVKFRLV
jgi:hypothetical protein